MEPHSPPPFSSLRAGRNFESFMYPERLQNTPTNRTSMDTMKTLIYDIYTHIHGGPNPGFEDSFHLCRRGPKCFISNLSPFRHSPCESPRAICTVLLDPRDPVLQSERTQGFTADPVYGRSKCLPVLGEIKT